MLRTLQLVSISSLLSQLLLTPTYNRVEIAPARVPSADTGYLPVLVDSARLGEVALELLREDGRGVEGGVAGVGGVAPGRGRVPQSLG